MRGERSKKKTVSEFHKSIVQDTQNVMTLLSVFEDFIETLYSGELYLSGP
jgi:hypothetical protein